MTNTLATARQTLTGVLDALDDAANAFELAGTAEQMPSFTCAEVDAFARLFHAAGREKLAEDFVFCHANEDKGEDTHAHIGAMFETAHAAATAEGQTNEQANVAGNTAQRDAAHRYIEDYLA